MYDFLSDAVSVKHFAFVALLCLFVYFVVLISVLLDFYSGVKRSKRLGISLKSNGFRRSIRKFNDYVNFMVVATLVDFLLYAFMLHEVIGTRGVPWLTLIGGLVAVAIEIKSIYENTDRSTQKDIALTIEHIADLAKTRGDADAILKQLADKMRDKPEGEDPFANDRPSDDIL